MAIASSTKWVVLLVVAFLLCRHRLRWEGLVSICKLWVLLSVKAKPSLGSNDRRKVSRLFIYFLRKSGDLLFIPTSKWRLASNTWKSGNGKCKLWVLLSVKAKPLLGSNDRRKVSRLFICFLRNSGDLLFIPTSKWRLASNTWKSGVVGSAKLILQQRREKAISPFWNLQ